MMISEDVSLENWFKVTFSEMVNKVNKDMEFRNILCEYGLLFKRDRVRLYLPDRGILAKIFYVRQNSDLIGCVILIRAFLPQKNPTASFADYESYSTKHMVGNVYSVLEDIQSESISSLKLEDAFEREIAENYYSFNRYTLLDSVSTETKRVMYIENIMNKENLTYIDCLPNYIRLVELLKDGPAISPAERYLLFK